MKQQIENYRSRKSRKRALHIRQHDEQAPREKSQQASANLLSALMNPFARAVSAMTRSQGDR